MVERSGSTKEPEEPSEERARPEGSPPLREHERRKADEEESLDARITHEVIEREGERELARSNRALAWSGLAAGLSMGFSLVAEGVLHAALPDAPWRPLLTKLGYSVGFLIVILGSQQLFTENTLTAIIPLLMRRNRKALRNVLRLWGIVLATNLLGAALFALVAARTTAFEPDLHRSFIAIGTEAAHGSFGTLLLQGVFAGWLIAIMVWMLPAAQSAHVTIIIIITYLIGLAGFPHIIAGSIEVMYLVARGELSIWQYLGGYAAPTLLGNILGGVLMVSAVNHAQVVAGGQRHDADLES